MNYQGQPKPGDVSQHEQMAKSKYVTQELAADRKGISRNA